MGRIGPDMDGAGQLQRLSAELEQTLGALMPLADPLAARLAADPQLPEEALRALTEPLLDRHRRLVAEAEALFRHFGLSNITAMVADGSRGLPDQAPFDRIMVTAAAEDPPGPLLAQLKIGGIMVVPVGQSDAVQTLIRVRRGENGFEYDELRQVRFVPLVEGLGQT